MRSFSFSKIVVMSVTFYLCIVTPSVSGKPNFRGVSSVSRYSTAESRIKHPLPPHDNHDNASSVRTTPPAFAAAQRMGTQEGNKSTSRDNPRRMSKASTRAVSGNAKTPSRTPTPTKRRRQNDQPTPEPTGEASTETTVYIDGADTFALLLPRNPGGEYLIETVCAGSPVFLFSQSSYPMQRKTVSPTVRMGARVGRLFQPGLSQALRTRQHRMGRTCR